MKTSLTLFALLAISSACSSGFKKMNETANDISYGAPTLENTASTVDRAIATEERIREKYDSKKK